MIPCASCFTWPELAGLFGPEIQQRAASALAAELAFPLLYSAVALAGLFCAAFLLKKRSTQRQKKAVR